MPDERGFFGSLNTIKTLVESTCDDKWHVLVETALPAAGEALWLLLIPSPEEILENYLQPRPSRSDPKRRRSGHGRRQMTRWGQLRWWQRLSFPDIDNIVANRLPGAEAIQGRRVGTPERWFWFGVDVLDRIGWYWLLIDAAETFVTEWGSNIIESRFCQSPMGALFAGHSTPPTFGPDMPIWLAVSNLSNVENNGWNLAASPMLSRVNPFIGVSGHCVIDFNGDFNAGSFGSDFIYSVRVIAKHTVGLDTIHFGENVTISAAGNYTLTFQQALTDVTELNLVVAKLAGPTGGQWQNVAADVTFFARPD